MSSLPTSGQIFFHSDSRSTDSVKTFFSNSATDLTSYRRGAGIVVNPTVYGSSTVGKGDILANANGGSIPLNEYDYGGVVPSLDTEANSAIASGSNSISLTTLRGAYKVVNPSVTSISLVSQTNQQQWNGGTPLAYYGFYGVNYAALGSGLPDYCRLLYCQSVSNASTNAAVVRLNLTLSHPGIYALRASTFGNNTSGCSFSASGTGVTLKNHALSTVTGTQTLPVTAYASNARFYELHVSDESQTITLDVTSSGSGAEGFTCAVHIKTNCNYLQHVNTTDTTNKTVHLAQKT